MRARLARACARRGSLKDSMMMHQRRFEPSELTEDAHVERETDRLSRLLLSYHSTIVMAGTRLRILVTFLGPFVAWIAVAAVTGLRGDVLWRRLRTSAAELFGHRPADAGPPPLKKNRTATAALEASSSSVQHVAPVRIIVTESSQVSHWEESARQLPPDLYNIQVVSAVGDGQLMRRLCADPAVLDENESLFPLEDGDLWICQFEDATDTAAVVSARLVLMDSGAAVYYPGSTPPRSSSSNPLSQIFPSPRTITNSKPWRLTVWLDRDFVPKNWKSNLQKVDQWFLQHREGLFAPCVETTDWGVELVPTTKNAMNNKTHPLTDAAAADSVLLDAAWLATRSDGPRAILYIPFEENAKIQMDKDANHDDKSNPPLAAVGEDLLIAVVIGEATTTTVESALDHLMEQVLVQCLGIPNKNDDASVEIAGVNTYFYETLFYHQRLATELAALERQATRVRYILQELPSTVSVPTRILADKKYTQAMEHWQTALQEAAQGWLTDALHTLDRATAILTELQTDPALVVTTDFPLEQYLAIFAPLLFPLLVPMLVTLVREWKRYRRLAAKQKQKQRNSESND